MKNLILSVAFALILCPAIMADQISDLAGDGSSLSSAYDGLNSTFEGGDYDFAEAWWYVFDYIGNVPPGDEYDATYESQSAAYEFWTAAYNALSDADDSLIGAVFWLTLAGYYTEDDSEYWDYCGSAANELANASGYLATASDNMDAAWSFMGVAVYWTGLYN